MTNIADYLDYVDPADRGIAGFGGGGHHGGGGHPGGHHGGGGWHGGGGGWGWGGPGYWGGSYEPQIITVEREAPRPDRYIGVRPGETLRCAQQPIGDGLWRCHLGIIYDVTKYELRANGLVRRGLAGFGADVKAPIRMLTTTPFAPQQQQQMPTALRPGTALPSLTYQPSSTPTSTPTPGPSQCPPGSTFDAAQNACVCGPGTGPNAEGTACVPMGGGDVPTGDGSQGAGGGESGSSSGWLWIAVGAFVAWRALKK